MLVPNLPNSCSHHERDIGARDLVTCNVTVNFECRASTGHPSTTKATSSASADVGHSNFAAGSNEVCTTAPTKFGGGATSTALPGLCCASPTTTEPLQSAAHAQACAEQQAVGDEHMLEPAAALPVASCAAAPITDTFQLTARIAALAASNERLASQVHTLTTDKKLLTDAITELVIDKKQLTDRNTVLTAENSLLAARVSELQAAHEKFKASCRTVLSVVTWGVL